MKIEITQTKKDEWRFFVLSGNGKLLCRSEGYRNRRNARDGVKTLIEKVTTAVVVEVA